YIEHTEFPTGTRTMLLEGLMYSLRLHMLLLRPIRILVDRLFFREAGQMKKISLRLEQMVCDFTIPRPGSWLSTLVDLRREGKLTKDQVRGEITSMLVSSFSLASALSSMLLCLAARPQYRRKIHDDPAFARYFVMEVLRLYPPFRQFGYERSPGRGDKQPNESHEFMVSVFKLHRNENVWKDPHKFYPERFQDPESTRGFKYMPFGMGKRMCSGRMFSTMMLVEAAKYVCSDESPIVLLNNDKLPRGRSGRLVSFALDDTLTYRAR
ncbi:MAG TPA: cytochrome P450, partial [Candidatus Omnitrophota bacterium]|nr:cytochrome P450 [Candidatus Omnitrophota bacterium]